MSTGWRVGWIAFALLGIAFATWLLTTYMHSPILASCLMIAAVGWMLFHFGRANVWGVVLWGLAAAILSAGFWTPEPDHGLFVIPRGVVFGVGGFLLSLPAGAIFFVASAKNPSRCAGSMIVRPLFGPRNAAEGVPYRDAFAVNAVGNMFTMS